MTEVKDDRMEVDDDVDQIDSVENNLSSMNTDESKDNKDSASHDEDQSMNQEALNDSGNEGNVSKSFISSSEELSSNLDEDDLELLEQSNLGSKGNFRRLQRKIEVSSGEEAEADKDLFSTKKNAGVRRKVDLDKLFEEESEEEESRRAAGSASESDEDDLQDFIEDDLGGDVVEDAVAIAAKERKVEARRKMSSAGMARFGTGLSKDVLQDMLDIFGDGTEYLDAVDEDFEHNEREGSRKPPKSKFIEGQIEKSAEDFIRETDLPERYIALGIVPFSLEKGEKEEETAWVVERLYPVVTERIPELEKERLMPVVASVLTLIRDQGMEVPFIATHRKEYFQHLLGLNDLWRILDWDEQWRAAGRHTQALMQIIDRKNGPETVKNVENLFTESRLDIEEMSELTGDYFRRVLCFGQQPTTNRNKSNGIASGESLDLLCKFVRSFTFDPTTFLLNWAMKQHKYPPTPSQEEPSIAARESMGEEFETESRTLSLAVSYAATELTYHPKTNKMFKGALEASARISTVPTAKGLKEIGMSHELAPYKFVTDKPVSSFMDDLYLRLLKAQKNGLLTVSIGFIKEEDLLKDWESYYVGMAPSDSKWVELRKRIFKETIEVHVLPRIKKAISAKLEKAAEAFVGQCCQYALQSKLMQAPYKRSGDLMAICWGQGTAGEATMTVLLDSAGRVLDQGKFAHLQDGRQKRSAEWERLATFIKERTPSAIVVGGLSTKTVELFDGLVALVKEIGDIGDRHRSKVLFGDDDTARIYQNSPRATLEFPEYGEGLKYCVSLGRRWLCPLYELAAVTMQEAVSRLSLHPSQGLVSTEIISKYIERAFVNVVNLVGLDINRAISSPWARSALKYVAGLGPVKAEMLIQALIPHGRLDRIVDLADEALKGFPHVYANCASFLFIVAPATHRSGRSADAGHPAEPLDETRIHPENYVLARKIACDALEVNLEEAEDQDVTARASIISIMRRPEKLNDLLLDEYARELEKRLHVPKHLTLLDIKAELQAPYADLRSVMEEASSEIVFEALTGETERTLFIGQKAPAKVVRLTDRAAICKLENGLTGIISLSCLPSLNSTGRPPSHPRHALQQNQAILAAVIGIDLGRFEVELSLLPEDLREPRAPRVGDFDPYYDHEAAKEASRKSRRGFSSAGPVESSGPSSLSHASYHNGKNPSDQPLLSQRRMISHPLYKEIGRSEAEAMLEGALLGEVIIRPSASRGPNHLALTWKVDSIPSNRAEGSGEPCGLFQHIDIEEREKASDYSLGRKLLIKSPDGHLHVYEDLDEIIARHVEPISAFLQDARKCPKFLVLSMLSVSASRAFVETFLAGERAKAPGRIAYCLSLSRDRPGAILLSYQPASRCYHELVEVSPTGFVLRSKSFDQLEALINWFKQNYSARK